MSTSNDQPDVEPQNIEPESAEQTIDSSIPSSNDDSNSENDESNDQEQSSGVPDTDQPAAPEGPVPAAEDGEAAHAESEETPAERRGPANALGAVVAGLPVEHAGDPAAVQCPICQHRFIPQGDPADMDGATTPS